jgi:hypothetical protein
MTARKGFNLSTTRARKLALVLVQYNLFTSIIYTNANAQYYPQNFILASQASSNISGPAACLNTSGQADSTKKNFRETFQSTIVYVY